VSNDLQRNADGMEDLDAFFSPTKDPSEYSMSTIVNEVPQTKGQQPMQQYNLFDNEEEENMSMSMDIEQSMVIAYRSYG